MFKVKAKIRPKTRPEIQYEWSLRRRPACQTQSKTSDILTATARVALHLLKTLAILLDSAVEREVLKLTSKCEKGHIFRGDQQAYCLKICQKERTKFQESQTLMFY